MSKKVHTPSQALEKLRNYCGYQERCHQEVRHKLLSLGIVGDTLEDILTQLIEEGFLDEMRFAKSYVRGKFRNKGWGRNRIKMELNKRQIGEYLIKVGMKEIEEEVYIKKLSELLEKKLKSMPTNLEKQIRRQKLFAFAYQRGFETECINPLLDRLDYPETN